MSDETKKYRIWIQHMKKGEPGETRQADVKVRTDIQNLMTSFAEKGWLLYQYYELG